MPKRKRGAEPSLPEKLEQHENEVYKALKLAKGFERQRLGKRAQDKGITDEKKARLEKEMEVLKGLDLQATAKTHLQSSLLKVKAIAASSDLPDVLKVGADGKKKEKDAGADEEEEKARHNVTSALYNRDGVKKAVERAVEGVCEALSVPVPEKVKKVKRGDDAKNVQEKKKNVKKEEKMDVDGESEEEGGAEFEGFESDVDEPGPVIGEEQLEEIKARVGTGAPQTCNACWKTFATERLAGTSTAETALHLCTRPSKKADCERCEKSGLHCEEPAELVLPWCDAYQELDAHLVVAFDESKKSRLEKLQRQVLSSMLLTMRLLGHPELEAMRVANGDITSRLYGSDDDEEEEDDDESEDGEDEDDAAFEDEGALSKYDSRLGHSSDEDNDDDKEEKFFAQLRRQKAAAKQKQSIDLDDISGSDPGNDTDLGSLSDSSSRSASPLPQSKKPLKPASSKPEPPKPKVKKSKKGETFLPSLMGGYISGSESASDIDIAPPKKRLGQRQRQAIAEKKYGDKAKHVEKAKKEVKWDAKRGAVGAGDGPRWKRGRDGGDRRGGRGEEDQVVVKKETKRDDGGVLHPSWEARKKAKEGAKAVAFEGAKITFD